MAETPTALPPGTRILDYTIDGPIGAPGHFGITYLARDARGARVALKEFFPAEIVLRDGEALRLRRAEDAGIFRWGLRGFVDEAQLLARFQHPNIVRGLAAFEANGTAYLAMEHVAGESFAEVLQREGRMREVRLRPFLIPVVDGMAQAHAAGLLHRDICPHDVRIAEDGRPVLTDFAAARNVLRFKSRSVKLAFTPGYAPIEEYLVSGRQGVWTDVYSLAAVAYRAITGQVPPEAPERKLADTLAPAVEAGKGAFDEAFLRAVDWGLRVEPSERPQRIADWREALDGEREVPEFAAQVARPVPVEAPAAPAPEPANMPVPVAAQPGPRPRSKLPLVAGSAAALLVAGLSFALLRDDDEPSPTANALEMAQQLAEPAQIAPAPEPASAMPAAQPAREELSGLDRIALQMLEAEQRKQAQDQTAREQELEAAQKLARENAAREQADVQRKLAEEQDAERRKALEAEQARLAAAEEQRVRQAELARLETEPLPPSASAVPVEVAQKRADQCRVMHVSALSGSGRPMTYADAGRVRGATIDDASGVIRLPPMKVEGRTVEFEVQPDGCLTIRR